MELIVIKCPSKELALFDGVYLSPHDYGNNPVSFVQIKGHNVFASPSYLVKDGMIAMNKQKRIFIDCALGDIVEVVKLLRI